MFCRNCGKEMQDDWMVCPNCGTKILTASVTQKRSTHNFERIKYRNFWAYFVLSLLTFGIYALFFFYGFIKDINKVCDGDGKKSPNFIVVLLLCIITFGIYGIYWWYVQGDRLYNIAPKYHVQIREQGGSILLWLILGMTIMPGLGTFVALYIMFDNMNTIAKVYNGDVSEYNPQKINHPHLVRNALIVYGIALAINIGLLVLVIYNVAKSEFAPEKESKLKYKSEIVDESTTANSDTLINPDGMLDAFINLDRFLIVSEDGIADMYVTVYYGNDSRNIKEVVYETFISKEYYTADKVDPNNINLSDFSQFYEIFPGASFENVQDIGNYYLLTVDYTDMDDSERLKEYIIAGAFEVEGNEEGDVLNADYFMKDFEDNGCVEGLYAEKEYSSYFGSGREGYISQSTSQEEYIFSNSDKQYLSEEEVRSTSAENLFIGRNEIFARHGYIFKNEDLRAHFESTSWYVGTVPGDQFSNEVLNDFEKKNIELIKKIEEEKE